MLQSPASHKLSTYSAEAAEIDLKKSIFA